MSNPIRFFLSSADSAIRIELPDGDSTYATLNRFEDDLIWHYGTPDERVSEQCLEAVLYQYAFDFARGFSFQGAETLSEMDRQCSARCQTCRTVMASHNDLSLHGDCPRCFVRKEAA